MIAIGGGARMQRFEGVKLQQVQSVGHGVNKKNNVRVKK